MTQKQTYIVTGGNTGLGYQCARFLGAQAPDHPQQKDLGMAGGKSGQELGDGGVGGAQVVWLPPACDVGERMRIDGGRAEATR